MADAQNSIQVDLDVIGELNFVYLASPFPSKKDDGTIRLVYKTSVLLDPNTPDGAQQIANIKAATRQVAAAAWANSMQVLEKLSAQDKLALHNGDFQDLTKYPEYKGKLFINCAYNPKPGTPAKPPCVATLGTPPANVQVEPGHPNFPYSGSKGLVKISLYAQSPDRKPVGYGQRIVCQLKGVQFLAHGQQRGGGGPRLANVSEFGINPLDADGAIPLSADAGSASGLF
jgi:hypothetical protein